jgi:hypothetical protein
MQRYRDLQHTRIVPLLAFALCVASATACAGNDARTADDAAAQPVQKEAGKTVER